MSWRRKGAPQRNPRALATTHRLADYPHCSLTQLQEPQTKQLEGKRVDVDLAALLANAHRDDVHRNLTGLDTIDNPVTLSGGSDAAVSGEAADERFPLFVWLVP